MIASQAIKALEGTDYGNLEGFCLFVISEYPNFIGKNDSPLAKADRTGLPLKVCLGLLQSKDFQATLTRMMAAQEVDFEFQMAHLEKIKEYAKGVGTGKAKATEAIAAGKYLQQLRGTPLHEESAKGGVVININAGARLSIEAGGFMLPGAELPPAVAPRHLATIASLTSGEDSDNADLSSDFGFYGEQDEDEVEFEEATP